MVKSPDAGVDMQPTDWAIKMNKKERRLAVATALQSATGDIIVAENIRVRQLLMRSLMACFPRLWFHALWRIWSLAAYA